MAADVAALTEEGVTKIIGLTHVGLPRDIEIAAAVPGLDAIDVPGRDFHGVFRRLFCAFTGFFGDFPAHF